MSIIFHIDVNSAFLSWTASRRLQEDPASVDLRTIPSIIGGNVRFLRWFLRIMHFTVHAVGN